MAGLPGVPVSFPLTRHDKQIFYNRPSVFIPLQPYRYRRYVYEAGAIGRSEKPGAGVIDNSVLENERKNNFELKRVQRFRYRTRYFTDSGIIGSKEFVFENYRRFIDLFMSKRDKIPKPVAGLDGVFSLKRLVE